MKKLLGIFLALSLLFLIFGCSNAPNDGRTGTGPGNANNTPPITGPEQKEFKLGDELAIRQGGIYTNSGAGLKIGAKSFSDSTCKPGAQCIWAGEQGANLVASDANGSAEIFLGQATAPDADFLTYYTAQLLSIDAGAQIAKVKFSRIAPHNGLFWLYYEPAQCGTNPWERWAQGQTKKYGSDSGEIKAWLDAEKGIKALEIASKKVYDVVCAACSCPRGDRVAVLVARSDSAKMESLGWKLLNGTGAAACTKEAMVCPDGTAIGRAGPFCDFAPCAQHDFYIRKTDVPGFAPNPKWKTTYIDGNGSVTVEEKDSGGNVSAKSRTLLSENIGELKKLAEDSGFFTITRQDTRTCIADAPSVNLTIISGGKTATLTGINAWCDKAKQEKISELARRIGEIGTSAS